MILIYNFRHICYYNKYEFFPFRRKFMTQETKKRIHLIYGIVLSAVAVLAGICLIAACCNIYYSGVASGASQIYTRQIVAQQFAKIAVPVYACLILVIGGMVLNLALPLEKAKVKPEKNLPLILRKLREKTALDACDAQLRSAIEQQQLLRKNLLLGCAILLCGGLIMFLIYACNGSNWGSNSTPSMVTAMMKMLRALAVPFLFTVYSAYQHRKSLEKEIELMRQASVQAPKAAQKPTVKAGYNRCANILRIAILAIGVLLVVLGACNEGTKDILTKAVNICTECVGLG